ncbi:MAG: ABC transporter permease [Pseudomonadota bacterium]
MSSAVRRGLDILEALARLWPFRGPAGVGWSFLAPALLIVGVLVIGLGYMIEASLRELDITTYRLRDEYSLGNYQTFWSRDVYLSVLTRTLLGALLVTAITLLLALPYAYLMVRTTSAAIRKALLVALFLPFFIGQVVRAYGWLIILGREGLVNSAVAALGFEPLPLLFNFSAVIFGLVQYMLPFAILLLVPALQAIPEDYERAAEGLGAPPWRTFATIVLPLARPGLIGAGIVVFTLTLTDFAMPEILGGGTQDFFASTIYDSFFQISNAGLGAALSMVLVTLGSLIVAGVFALAGTGTLGARA